MKTFKKIIVLLFVLAITVVSAKSQFLRFGPKVGVSATKAIVEENYDLSASSYKNFSLASGDRKLGFHAGLFARVSIAGFHLQPEVLFSSVNGQIDIDAVDENNEVVRQVLDMSYNKLEVPVLIGKSFGDILHVEIGPVFNYMLTNDAREGGFLEDVKQNYSNSTVGYQLGFGFDIGDVTIDLRYEGGLSKLGDSVNFGNQSFNTDLRDDMFMVSVGFNLF